MRSVPVEAAASRRVTLKRVLTPQGSASLSCDCITVSAVLSLCSALGASAAVICASSLLEIAFLRKFAADFYSAGSIGVLLDFGFERKGCWMIISKGCYTWTIIEGRTGFCDGNSRYCGEEWKDEEGELDELHGQWKI